MCCVCTGESHGTPGRGVASDTNLDASSGLIKHLFEILAVRGRFCRCAVVEIEHAFFRTRDRTTVSRTSRTRVPAPIDRHRFERRRCSDISGGSHERCDGHLRRPWLHRWRPFAWLCVRSCGRHPPSDRAPTGCGRSSRWQAAVVRTAPRSDVANPASERHAGGRVGGGRDHRPRHGTGDGRFPGFGAVADVGPGAGPDCRRSGARR